jgi:hypothetical protein
MRHFLIFIFLITIFYSCQENPGMVGNEKDSFPVTVKNDVSVVDTAIRDSVNGAVMHYDCSVLKRRIPNDTNSKQIQRDLQEMRHCGIDSFDFVYVVPNLFPGWWSENIIQGNKNVTYGDFLKHLNEFRTTSAYPQLHERVKTVDSLNSIPFDPKKLYAMKPILGRLGFTEPEWEQFEGFARTYPIPKKRVFSWGDMVQTFDKYKPE